MAAAPCNADLLRVSSTSACSISATCFRTRTSRLLAFSRRKFARPPPSWVLYRRRQVIPQAPGRSSSTSRHQKRRQSSKTPVSSRIVDRIPLLAEEGNVPATRHALRYRPHLAAARSSARCFWYAACKSAIFALYAARSPKREGLYGSPGL